MRNIYKAARERFSRTNLGDYITVEEGRLSPTKQLESFFFLSLQSYQQSRDEALSSELKRERCHPALGKFTFLSPHHSHHIRSYHIISYHITMSMTMIIITPKPTYHIITIPITANKWILIIASTLLSYILHSKTHTFITTSDPHCHCSDSKQG